jgi:hypothetical protein
MRQLTIERGSRRTMPELSIDLEAMEVSETPWDGFTDLMQAIRYVVIRNRFDRTERPFTFAQRFAKLELVSGPNVQPPADDNEHLTVKLASALSAISLTFSGPGGDRILLVEDERARKGLAINLDRGPSSAGTKKMRVDFDGTRIRIERRGMLPFTQWIELNRGLRS